MLTGSRRRQISKLSVSGVRAVNFLIVYAQAEIGEDIPRKRPRRLARRLLLAIVVGAAAGMAVMLGIDGWGALIREAGGSCGTNRGACPRGITPALLLFFLLGLWAVPAAFWMLFARGWDRRALVAITAAGGVLAGQSAWGALHGQDLAVAWTASYDPSFELTTVGAWTHGDALIRVRVDGPTSYDGATGRPLWSFTLPGTDVACSVSGSPGTTEQAVGLIAFGQDSSSATTSWPSTWPPAGSCGPGRCPTSSRRLRGRPARRRRGHRGRGVARRRPSAWTCSRAATKWTGPAPGGGVGLPHPAGRGGGAVADRAGPLPVGLHRDQPRPGHRQAGLDGPGHRADRQLPDPGPVGRPGGHQRHAARGARGQPGAGVRRGRPGDLIDAGQRDPRGQRAGRPGHYVP